MLVDHLDWGFWYSDSFCTPLIYSFEIFNMLFMMIDLFWSRIPIWLFSLCLIIIFVWDIDMLIVSIVHLVSLSIVIPILAMTILIALHVWIRCYIFIDLTCWFSSLYILLIVFEHDVYTYHFSSDRHSLYVCMNGISCTLLDRMLHDCPPSAWLHVACLCGSHFYPPTFNSLGFGHSFHPGSHYCKCETFCVLALWSSQRLGVGSSDRLYRCAGAF